MAAFRDTFGSRSLSSRTSRENNPWPPERPDPWTVAVEDHNIELRAQHQESLKDFSRSSTKVQQWILDKQAELSEPKGQGRDQMDRVMFLLATGRGALQREGGGDANLKDVKDAIENQKIRRRINSPWCKKIEASHKDLLWISKYRQKEKARQQERVGSPYTTLPRAAPNSGSSGGDLSRSWSNGTTLQRSGSTQEVGDAPAADVRSPMLRTSRKTDPEPAAEQTDGASSPAQPQETVDSADPIVNNEQDESQTRKPTVPSYMAANESWRRRNMGFCRGRAIRGEVH